MNINKAFSIEAVQRNTIQTYDHVFKKQKHLFSFYLYQYIIVLNLWETLGLDHSNGWYFTVPVLAGANDGIQKNRNSRK